MSLVLTLPWVVLAQVQPAPPPPDPDLEKQFQDSLKSDAAAARPPAPAPAAATSPALSNPEIAVIGTFSAVARRDGDVSPSFQAGDDPTPEGLDVQELELSFAADVDPYFRMRAFLAMPAADEIEIEEAYLETTALPRGFALKAGTFRSSFGRNNEQHLHVQDFARRPKMTAILGEDGLRAPGAQLSWLLPLPWYTALSVEALGLAQRPSVTAGLEQFFDLSGTWSLLWGVTGANLQRGLADDAEEGAAEPDREWLLGTDVYLKWKPTNVVNTYAWVALTAEYAMSRTADKAWDGSGYAQIVAQVARRWRVGVRGELEGYPRVAEARAVDVSASLSFLPSELSRVRLTYAHDHPTDDGAPRNDYVILQLEGAIGAHGAHPF